MTIRDALVSAAPALLAAALLFGPVAAWLAARRVRNPALWLALGALTGPVALFLLFASPPGRCPACAEPSRGFETTCQTCGSALRSSHGKARRSLPVSTRANVAPGAVGAATPGRAGVALPSGESIERRPAERAELPAEREESTAQRARRLIAAGGGLRAGEAWDQRAGVAEMNGHGDLTVLAIAVFVNGSEPLLAGFRYLIARTADRLLVIGPIEPSTDHVELDLPLAGIEASYVPDRLVVGGWSDSRSRRWILAFQSLAGLTASAVDEALMAPPERLAAAVRRS